MKKYITHNPEETKQIAAALAHNFQGGEVLGLTGNLGAGKTNFVQGLAKCLDIKKQVNSPTFVLIKLYPTKNKKIKLLVHIDCYRLNQPEELLSFGIEEYLNDKRCLTVIEWADKIEKILPEKTIWIKFKLGKNIEEREIEIK